MLREAIDLHPRDERNYLAVARLSIDEDLAAVGMRLLDQGLLHLPKSPPLLLQRGYLRLSQGIYKQAEADYRAAMDVQPASYAAKIGLAFVFFQSQRQSDATELLEQVIESHASTFFSYYLLGELRIREGLTEDALKYTKQAAALEDGSAAVHTNLGKLYIKKKKYTSAIRELQRATVGPGRYNGPLPAFYCLPKSGGERKVAPGTSRSPSSQQTAEEAGDDTISGSEASKSTH